jgi:hypothetical protein
VRAKPSKYHSKRRAWVLDSGTKGTGAEMVPLDKVVKKPAPKGEPVFVPPKPRPRPVAAPEPRQPRRFRVVDVLSTRVLAEDADARATVRALEGVRCGSGGLPDVKRLDRAGEEETRFEAALDREQAPSM